MKKISRREFLKGSAAGAVSVGLLSLVGCSKETESTPCPTPAPCQTSTARWSWEEEPVWIQDADIKETVEADVVVVGAGIAGCTAFMTSSEAGAKTILVDKVGNYSARGMDIAAIGTTVQESANVSINKGKIVDDLMQAAGYKANGSLLKLWADHSGEALNDIIAMCQEDDLTCELDTTASVSAEGDGFWNRTYPVTHHLGVKELGNSGCMMHIAEREINRGIDSGNGSVVYKMEAVQLVKEGSKVTGVICKDESGEYTKYIASKGVILATGDFASNPEMVDAWCPIVKETENMVYNPAGANTGDGIKMAIQVGGTMQKGPHAPMVHPIMGGGAMGTFAFLRVNKDGCRFGNEDVPLPGITNGFMTAPGHVVWTIFDSDYNDQLPKMTPQSQYSGGTSGPCDPSLGLSFDEQLAQTLESGTSVTADNFEDLAKVMGVPVESFVSTLESYNTMCINGQDTEFNKSAMNLFELKKPPFYASKVTAALLAIASGLNVDGNLAVCDTNGEAIEGLYAIGNTAGNMFAGDYPILAPGISHGRCITFGYLLGAALAKGEKLQ